RVVLSSAIATDSAGTRPEPSPLTGMGVAQYVGQDSIGGSDMIRKFAFVTVVAGILGVALLGATADVTFVLKNGDRVSGTLVYRHTTDFTVVRDGREQTFPSDDIALIQFTGGDPSMNELEQLPNVDNNPNELERHVFVFRNGNVMRGKLHDIVDNWFDVDAQAGGRRKHDRRELARLYFNPA